MVVFRANISRIANLTLRQTGGKDTWHGADIGQGRLELEGCDINSHSGPCVAIHGGADPRLRRNTIHDGKGRASTSLTRAWGTALKFPGLWVRSVRFPEAGYWSGGMLIAVA